MKLLKGAHLSAKNKEGKEVHICKNDVPHTGKLVLCSPKGKKDGIYNPMPGVAIKNSMFPFCCG